MGIVYWIDRYGLLFIIVFIGLEWVISHTKRWITNVKTRNSILRMTINNRILFRYCIGSSNSSS